MSKGAILLHASAVAVMAWGYRDLQNTVLNSYIEGQKGGHFQFLTIQALALAWITMLCSLVGDFLPMRQLRNAKRALLLIALPISVVVSLIYWPLILFLPSLILQSAPAPSVPSSSSDIPRPALARIPLSLDLALHLAPAFSLLTDFFQYETSFGRSVAVFGSAAMSAAFGLWYAVWVEYCASYNGSFPYPFLNVILPLRVAIYVTVTYTAYLMFRRIDAFHVWYTTPYRP